MVALLLTWSHAHSLQESEWTNDSNLSTSFPPVYNCIWNPRAVQTNIERFSVFIYRKGKMKDYQKLLGLWVTMGPFKNLLSSQLSLYNTTNRYQLTLLRISQAGSRSAHWITKSTREWLDPVLLWSNYHRQLCSCQEHRRHKRANQYKVHPSNR